VKVRFATAPMIVKQMGEGAKADVVLAPPAVLDELAKSGKIDATTRTAVGKVGVGVASRNGGPTPDISSADALKKSVLSAETLAFNTASTGLYLDRLFEKMGITAEVKAKAKRYGNGEGVMEHLIKGKGNEFGFGAATEIVLFKDKGLRFVGPLPADAQNYTSYAATVHTNAANAKGAADFLKFIGQPGTRKITVRQGVRPGGSDTSITPVKGWLQCAGAIRA
jgi:molybdate transport system substrate-binding protein